MNIKAAYNDWAAQYDSNQNKTRDLDEEVTVRMLNELDFRTALELGCGTGKNTGFLLTKAAKVIGIDFSEQMLSKARAKFSTHRVTFISGDLLGSWAVPDCSVDLITCNLVLEHVNELGVVFEQAAQKLRPGGSLFVSELHPFKQYMGSRARYESPQGTVELETYVHHTSDYVDAAKACGFKLLKLNEWFDGTPAAGLPRLISFLFELPTKNG